MIRSAPAWIRIRPEITIEEQNAAGGTYTIKLASIPSTHNGAAASVSVAITSTNDDITLSPNPVVLNAGNFFAGVDVTVLAIDDADGVGETATLSHFATSQTSGRDGDYHNIPIPDVTVTVTDNDPVGVEFDDTTVVQDAHSVTVAEAGTYDYRVRLATEPTDEVTVTIVDPSDNTEVTTEPTTLTFNAENYTTWQDVTVSAAVDNDTFDDTATITHTVSQSGGSSEYDGVSVADVSVSVTDPDRSPRDVDGEWFGNFRIERFGGGHGDVRCCAVAPTRQRGHADGDVDGHGIRDADNARYRFRDDGAIRTLWPSTHRTGTRPRRLR